MERAGEKLKRAREKLRLTYREVERAIHMLAKRRANDEFGIALIRLADIEHKGTVPTIFRLYSLCVIYRLDLWEVLGSQRSPAGSMVTHLFPTPLPRTHPLHIQ